MTALAFAYGAGLLSTVNPCGFAMLPAFLAFSMGHDDSSRQHRATLRFLHGVTIGLALSAGFAAVFVTAGILLSAGLRSLITVVPWLAVGIGVVLATVGVAMLAGRHIGLAVGPITVSREAGRGHRRVLLFGMGYALASLSCTLAVFLAVIAQALATANVLRLLGVFAAYAAGGATVLTALSVSTAMAAGMVSRAVRRLLPIAGRLSGVLLVLSGAYLVAYWLPALVHPGTTANESVADISRRPSAFLTAVFSAHQQALGVVGGLILVATAGATLRVWLTRRAAAGGDGGGAVHTPDRRSSPVAAGLPARLSTTHGDSP